ncbi:MAG: glycosyltransferase [Oligoflexia bacterium]|nr:glycosyltransferase [Oligoflexia bacterium]
MEQSPSVLIDARMVGASNHGIATYLEQLTEGFTQNSPHFKPIFLTTNELALSSALKKFTCIPCSIPFLSPLEAISLPRFLTKIEHTIYVSPSFSSLLYYPRPYVQILHDLNHLIYGSIDKKLYYRFLVLRSLKNAAAIAGVSNFSKNEIQEWLSSFNISKKISLIPNVITKPSIESEKEALVLRTYQLTPQNYFFTLGNPKPHKNMLWLESLYKEVTKELEMPPLVTNQQGDSHSKIIRIPKLSDIEKNILYKNSNQFLYPSLYEGFGLPPMEAYLQNAPIALNKLDIFKENIGDKSGVYFIETNSKGAWKEHLKNYKNIRKPIEEEQKKLLETYSSKNQINAFYSVISSVLEKLS